MTFLKSLEVKIYHRNRFAWVWVISVLYETALIFFLFRYSRLRVKVSQNQGDESLPIVPHSEHSIWMLFCIPNLMSVFLRKIFCFLEFLFRILSET